MARTPTPAGPSYVALLGPIASGKSSLLASIGFGAQNMHGFSGDMVVKVVKGNAENPYPNHFRLLELRQAYERAVKGKRWEQAATESVVNQYPLRVVLGRGAQPGLDRQFSVLDSGGGLLLPGRAAASAGPQGNPKDYVGRDQELRDNLTNIIKSEVDGIVFCIDLLENDAGDWREAFDELQLNVIEKFAARQAPRQQLRRIALTFTKTDQLFTYDGSAAAGLAFDREEMLARLRLVLHSNKEVLEKWSHLAANMSDLVDVRCFATSTFGYVHGNGCVNYSWSGRGSNRQWLIGDDELTGAQSYGRQSDSGEPSGPTVAHNPEDFTNTEYLRPAMTLDPFIYAAFGEMGADGEELRSRFSFDLEELVTPVERPQRPSGGGLFGRFISRGNG